MSGIASANGHKSITPENFRKCCALFTARKSIKSTWINQKDEYSKPNTELEGYEQWNNDAIVYSLFNTASNQSSLRDVEYKGKIWQIKNEWFWLSKEKMVTLAEKHSNDAVYNDARADSDRFVYDNLLTLNLSPDALEVLNKATELLESTFEYREMADDMNSEWNVNTWDAGWYQVKLLLKEYDKAGLKEFMVLYKELEGRLRDGVFSYGFLRR